MSKRRRLRRPLAVLILLVILLVGGWTGIWYLVAGRLRDHVLAWERQQREAGWTVTQGTPRRTGWPMAAGITLPDIAITGGAQYLPGGMAWSAAGLTLALDIRHPDDLYLGVTGRQSLRMGGGRPIPFQAARMAGQVALLPGDRPGLLQMTATELIAATFTTKDHPAPLTVARLDAAARADGTAGAGGDALALAGQMSGVDLPPQLLPGLGRHVQALRFDAALSGPAPPAAAPADPRATAAAWREAGGSLALRAFHLTDGPLTLDATGRATLDAVLLPEAQAALTVSGVNETIADLADRHALTEAEARALTAMLGLMMRPPQPDRLQAPLELDQGIVSLGTIPLIRLPAS